jgi:putative protease
MDDSLELMTPAGMQPCEVTGMVDFRGAAADRLNPGTEGRIFVQEDVLQNTEMAKFGFIVKKNTANL